MKIENKFSKSVLTLCYVVILCTAFFFHSKWKSSYTEATLSWDVSGYYMYLPALFIYNDIEKCGFIPNIIDKYHPTPDIQQGFVHEKSGNFVMKYSAGQAVLMAPFFAVGHMIAKNSDVYPSDGFSYPYQMSIGVGMLVYSFLGIYLLYFLLTKYFPDEIAAVVLFAVVIGTNYMLFASVDQCLTHGPLFFLYALLMFLSRKFYQDISIMNATFIGLVIGLMTLIRPTEIIAILIPMFWGIGTQKELSDRFVFHTKGWRYFIIAGLFLVIIVSIQPLYWKYVTGDWIVYSYQDQGFSWLKPHFKDYTFSFSSGWLTYTPIMIFAFIGIPFAVTKLKNHILWVLFLFVYYIVCAWDVWDYGGTSGRAMVQYYPILAFMFGALLTGIWKYKFLRYVWYILAIFFIYINIWWVYHCYRGEVPAIGHSKYFYYAKVGRWTLEEQDLKLMDNKYLFKGKKITPKIVESNLLFSVYDTTQLPLIIGSESVYTPEMNVINNGQLKNWTRIIADIQIPSKEWNTHTQHYLEYKFYKDGNVVARGLLKPQRFLNEGERKLLDVDCKTPIEWEKLAVFFWNPGSQKEIIVRSVMIETFD
jgi:hypothetical protein